MIAQAVEQASALIRRFEGFRAAPYLCPAGIATIGFGSTLYADGRSVTLADPPVTREQADALLAHTIAKTYLPAVIRLCPGVTDPARLAALIDFTYNLGAGALRGSSLRRRVNAGDWEQVPDELRKWVKGGGRVLRGLVIRREAEAALIFS